MLFEATHHASPGEPVRLRGDARRIMLDDEKVSVVVELNGAERRDTGVVVIEERGAAGTRDIARIEVGAVPAAVVERDLRLRAGATTLRCRLDRPRSSPLFSEPMFVDVRKAPQILTLLSMGGASVFPGPDTPDGAPDAQADLDNEGIRVDPDRCRRRGIDATLIRTLTTNRNVQCNDLSDRNCVNFLEHLALRMRDDGLVDELRSIRGAGFAHIRTFADGLRNRVVLGKWENSEREFFRPAGVRTWEQILDAYRDGGGSHVILLGQSQGGAKFAEMVKDHWVWDDDVEIDLFVSWDATHFFGGITDVGPRPRTVLGFFQSADDFHFQNGSSILQATEEHDLTGLFSHNAIARSEFVHDKTVTFAREAITRIRNGSRRGAGTTFRRTPDGRLGEPIETRSVVPGATVAHAVPVGPSRVLFLAGRDRRGRTVRISDRGLLLDVVDEVTIPAEVTAATSCALGANAYLILLTGSGTELTVLRMEASGGIGAQVHSGPPGAVGMPFPTSWRHLTAVGVGTARFVCLVTASGDASVVRIGPDGTPEPVVGTRDLGTPSAVVGYEIGNQGYLAAVGNGISVFRLGPDGSLGPPVWEESGGHGLAPPGLTVAHAQLGARHDLVLHDMTGRVQIRSIDADGAIGPTSHQTAAGPVGQAALTCFEIGGAGYVHLLRRP